MPDSDNYELLSCFWKPEKLSTVECYNMKSKIWIEDLNSQIGTEWNNLPHQTGVFERERISV
jgi:hypothetical protein